MGSSDVGYKHIVFNKACSLGSFAQWTPFVASWDDEEAEETLF
jgi:hypothetical protein